MAESVQLPPVVLPPRQKRKRARLAGFVVFGWAWKDCSAHPGPRPFGGPPSSLARSAALAPNVTGYTTPPRSTMFQRAAWKRSKRSQFVSWHPCELRALRIEAVAALTVRAPPIIADSSSPNGVHCNCCHVNLPRSPNYPGIANNGGVPCDSKTSTSAPSAFEIISKRRKGFPSETRVKRGMRIVGGQKELQEKLGRNDPCPCLSGRRFQELLHAHW